MKKSATCNMDCFNCVHPDCINDKPDMRAYRAEWIARYRREHPEYVAQERVKNAAWRRRKRAERKAAGLCTECGSSLLEAGHTMCAACLQKKRELRRAK